MEIAKEPLRLLSGMAVQAAFDADVIPRYERAGGAVEIEWNPTAVLMKEISEGKRADVMLLTSEAVDDLVARGIAKASTRIELVRSNLGVAVKAGAAHPEIGTAQAFQEALVGARSVAYTLGGASGIYFGKLIEQLGIADAVNARATRITEGLTAAKLLTGEADLAVQQISELLAVEGIEVVGPFPEGTQKTLSFAVACFAESPLLEEGERFISHISDSASGASYLRFGLDPA
ncbi:molybdate ABC transporter substrate-binding protein [Paraburkholderia tropica]|uniref:molybdate ABC transporter substrate-binding protein n=1 Tax=Paraburkholderia tropica TaxID=92647 RepID=UPI00159013DB|nr:substrate-binding domain-containing protein [Paraburkholderia tropica]